MMGNSVFICTISEHLGAYQHTGASHDEQNALFWLTVQADDAHPLQHHNVSHSFTRSFDIRAGQCISRGDRKILHQYRHRKDVSLMGRTTVL